MSADVVTLRQVQHEPIADVVTALEQALESARAGEIIGVGIAAVLVGRSVATNYVRGEGTVADLHFAASNLTARVFAHEDEA